MISVFDHQNYRYFLRAWIDSQTGRGASSRLAETMNISPSMMSMVMKEEKNLTSEQASELVDFLALNELESDYFFILLELSKAGTQKLKARLEKKKDLLLKQARKISSRVKKDTELTEEQKCIFYSSWLYTGVMNLSACPNTQDVHKMAEHLKITYEVLQPVIEFLVENDFCKLEKGVLTCWPQNTHLGSESPYVNQHHRNWRLKANEKMDFRNEQDLFYTCPMSLSKVAFERVRQLLPTVIQQILKIVGPSSSEEVACFNLDFFKY